MPFKLAQYAAVLLSFLALPLVVSSAEPIDDGGIQYFEKHIRPLLVQQCYQCHSERTKKSEGDLLLDRRDRWLKGGKQGPSIVPGNVDGSLLIRAVRYTDPELQMPPAKALPADAVARLEHWIRIGAPGPANNALIDSPNPSDPIAGKSHWAFQRLQPPPPPEDMAQEGDPPRVLLPRQPPVRLAPSPALKDANWPRSPIDTFVAARREQQELHPVSDARPADLIRRVYFQLLGLPPSLEEVNEFLADDHPDALERVVDRLMASPHFGERWGRHWLDLARYSDSNGLDENFLFREAWRYRNYVISSVNEGIPLDRFLMEQLAGDLLPFESLEQRDRQRIAAGFLLVGPKVLLGNIEMNQRMEIADELIDTIGRAVLGQTLGCARCHDHKFDPIPTADYYSLAGIFTSTTVMEMRYMLGEQRLMERLVGLGAKGDEADDAYEKYWRRHPKVSARKKEADAALQDLKKDNQEAIAALIEKKSEALADDARDTSKSKEERISAQTALIAELKEFLKNPAKIPPRAMIPRDVETPADEQIRLAGQFDKPGQQVPRGFLAVLSEGAPIEIAPKESGRLSLSRWLFDHEAGAGPLTARVFANRVWHHTLGRGIVRTVDNFGRTGEAPTHPDLLDHLAGDLIESGWSLKTLLRHVVTSHTFALSSQYDPAMDAIDPENRMLWRAHRRRLDPESLRDAMLSVAGQLDVTPRDSTVDYLGDQATAVGPNTVRRRTDFPCRSVYLPVIRNDLPELFEAFDFTDPQVATGARPKTTAPSQSLYMLNADMVMDAAQATAKRVIAQANTVSANDPDVRIDLLFQTVLNTLPTDDVRHDFRAFVGQTEQRLKAAGDEKAELRSWALACQALFASTRFQFLE